MGTGVNLIQLMPFTCCHFMSRLYFLVSRLDNGIYGQPVGEILD